MGNIYSIYKQISELFNMEIRILLLGLDAAGKTTTLYKLKLNEVVTTIPTIGFNIETLNYKKMNLTVWDVGGQDKIRPLWKHYFQNTDALIFMIDSCDTERFEEARQEFYKIYTDANIKSTLKAILVFANKMDLPNAKNVQQIIEALHIQEIRHISWHVQATNAVSGEGLYEGLDKLKTMLTDHNKR